MYIWQRQRDRRKGQFRDLQVGFEKLAGTHPCFGQIAKFADCELTLANFNVGLLMTIDEHLGQKLSKVNTWKVDLSRKTLPDIKNPEGPSYGSVKLSSAKELVRAEESPLPEARTIRSGAA